MTYTYAQLALETEPPRIARAARVGLRAIEQSDFPIEELSEVAELESWRKEINRPIYHLHKWWAQRLGSIFRAILIGANESDPADVMTSFYAPVRYPGVVFDPFMGSGTTIGEAIKLGMRAIGRDINHVAYFAVRNALANHSRERVLAAYSDLEREIAPRIRSLYRTTLPTGATADVLYYFWVKLVPCPACAQPVDLFSTYVFARHAYPKRHPLVRIVCPSCGGIHEGLYDAADVVCSCCQTTFDPQVGPAQGATAICRACNHGFSILAEVQRQDHPPVHRMYAKLVLLPDGTKRYESINDEDRSIYATAESELGRRTYAYPVVRIEPGHNTNQALNYRYKYWHQLFNARQLLALSLLSERIGLITEPSLRELFVCLFSGVLEFNNLFASYKGEGTGAVRHMFSHHILKPERTPLEANVWGTEKSSGAFSTLFRSRLLRAIDYRDRPFELRPTRANGRVIGRKVFGLSAPMGRRITDSFRSFAEDEDSILLSCGDSSTTDLPDASVDLIVTDPPFFDNVHYSELADFFHVWQRHLLCGSTDCLSSTTRAEGEVQSRDAQTFSAKLKSVFHECRRVLRPDGLLIFSYHHSRSEGWNAVSEAIQAAGFVISAAHPIKAELSLAAPKAQARHPIDLDVIIVCRPTMSLAPEFVSLHDATNDARRIAEQQIERLARRGRSLSRNDVRVVATAQLIRAMSRLCAGKVRPITSDDIDSIANATFERLYHTPVGSVLALGPD
jgi:adenine-specific DNA methylase